MSFLFIDRRKAEKNKSAPNRVRLLKRIKQFVKDATPNMGSSVTGGGYSSKASPVNVTSSALEEPWFCYSRSGNLPDVYIGNVDYERGDEIRNPSDSPSSQSPGPGENGEDDFVVNVAAGEFLDLFFEDCELPNLENEKVTEKLDIKQQPAGFAASGNPAQLSVVRSYKQAVGRRRALTAPYRDEKLELEEELQALYLREADWTKEDHDRLSWIEDRMIVLLRKIGAVGMFDKIDLRYKKRENKPVHTVEAVLFIAMDVSGSMYEDRKRIARRWFALLYAFIIKRYPSAQVRFIAHTDSSFETSESEFFTTRVNGGTMVSPMLKQVNRIIREDYDSTQTNIYLSHASDGDNWSSDSPDVIKELLDGGFLMTKLQHFSYVEVGGADSSTSYGMMGSIVTADDDTELWESYAEVHDRVSDHKMAMVTLQDSDSCYPVFKKVFKKK